ncbi:flagellar export chaperone FliS [Pseudaeromonas sp. ZJS20]|uniref:flagellar export chaperone FliS n=1 Tax=Pseudaeromonas aegiceratis TaxID=3153928 RepID=UPI00390C7114
MYETGFDAYRQSEIQVRAATASPAVLVLMLLDGLLDELARAEGHLLARNYERKGNSIKKSMRILGALDASLDRSQGVELAENLHQLYAYCGRRLFKASVRNEAAGFGEVADLMRNIREGWEQVAARAA